MAAEGAHPSSPFLFVRDRIVPRSAFRPTPWADLSDTPAWWGALALLGALLTAAGGSVDVAGPETTAVVGVVLFLVTGVAAGAERAEIATALALGALVWSAAGISLTTGTDGAPLATAIGFGLVGVALIALGTAGSRRRRAARPVPDRA